MRWLSAVTAALLGVNVFAIWLGIPDAATLPSAVAISVWLVVASLSLRRAAATPSTAIWVVIVALAPIVVSSYGLTGHQLWLVCSLLALAFLVVMMVVFLRTPENQAVLADNLATVSPALTALVMVPTFWVPLVLLVLALALVVLGPLPSQEQALYLTAVALGLLMGALGMFVAVFWQRRPSVAADQALPAPGGSNS